MKSRELFDEADREIFALLSPHVRRALMISGMRAENRFRANLQHNLLDKIATGIMIVAHGGKLVYANASAESAAFIRRKFRLAGRAGAGGALAVRQGF